MKTKNIINGLLIGSLLVSPVLQAAHTATEKGKSQVLNEQAKGTDNAVKKLEKEQNALLKSVHKGVLEGYASVVKATRLLSKSGKEKAAIKLLQEATGKFDVALAADPKLSLTTIEADVSVSELITTPALIKRDTDAAIDLLKDHKVQDARALLETMKDEMVISHAYLPMATYPAAIKLATKYLVENKKEDALATLATALSTIEVEESIVPLAIVRTENLLKKASELDKSKKSEAHALLDAAQEQLEIATLLGYTDEESKSYEDLKAQIKAVKKEIDGKNEVEKMYDKLKKSIRDLISKEKENNK